MVALLRTVGTRLASGVLVLFIVTVATFFGTALVPWRPEAYLLGSDASAEAIADLHARLGIDRPLLAQYWDWLSGVFQGRLGTSWSSSQPVTTELGTRVPVTLSLVIAALVFATVVGLGTGIGSALSQGKWKDRALSSGMAISQSIPEFWLGILLVTVFALHWSIFPATGYVPLDVSPARWLESIALPSLALGLPISATFGRHIRSAMIGELGRDYVRWSVSVGLSRRYVANRAVLRNALGTVMPILAFQVVVVLSLSVVVEKVFAIEGVGSMILNAVLNQDIPVLLGGVLFYGVVVVVANLVADLGQAAANPRARVA